MNHPLQCLCGKIRGEVIDPGTARRAMCYCKDCQAFARFLRREGDVLDEHLGTGIVATLPSNVRFADQGLDTLACMSLSPKGLLRWYCRICSTPIGNTPRNPGVSYLGLVDTCLKPPGAPPLDASFGPVRIALNTKSARGHVKSSALTNVVAIFGLMKTVIGARLGGGYRVNPLFDADTGRPLIEPMVISAAERAQLTEPGQRA